MKEGIFQKFYCLWSKNLISSKKVSIKISFKNSLKEIVSLKEQAIWDFLRVEIHAY